MNGITHLLVGASVGAIITGEPVGAAVGAIAGLLPDIDHPHSILGRRLWLISAPLNVIVGHRGALHSLIAAIGLAALFRAILPDWWVVITAAYVSHLLADVVTVSGVPLLWPLRWRARPPRLLALRSGGRIEMVFLLTLVCLWCVQAYQWAMM